MLYELFIARRYLFSKKSTNAINIISAISMVGVAIATMALVVTLSVFNGFHDMVASFLTQFDPQLKVVPIEGKMAPADDPVLDNIRKLPEIDIASDVVEDQALAVYGERQAMVTIKGVEDNFSELTHINDILVGDGDFELWAGDIPYATIGIRLAVRLGTGARFSGFLRVFAPQREGQFDMMNPEGAFVEDSLMSPGVVFEVKQGHYDDHYIIVPLSLARRLFAAQGMVSSLELRLKSGSNFDRTKKKIESLCSGRYKVLDRYEQQADTFQIMNIEKLLAYVFLTFILLIASFNIIGSLSMLIIDKRADVVTLRNLGATDSNIRRIFLFEGWLISFVGAIVGIVLGLLLCLLQEQFGLLRLGDGSASYVVNAYPVSVHFSDIIVVFLTVVGVGLASIWYPVRYMTRRGM